MIYTNATITVKDGKATLNRDIYIYKDDGNITIRFKIVNNSWSFLQYNDHGELTEAEPPLFILRLMKGNEVQKTFINQDYRDGTANLLITNELTDESIEMGDYDFQITLYDNVDASYLSIPPVYGQIHIKEHIFD